MVDQNKANEAVVVQPKTVTGKKKERKTSVTYTLQRLRDVLKTLAKSKMLTEEEAKQLAEIYNNIYSREMGGKLEL